MSTRFDPFCQHTRLEPEPVDGPLAPVELVDEEDRYEFVRPTWVKTTAMVLAGLFGLTLALGMAGTNGLWFLYNPTHKHHARRSF